MCRVFRMHTNEIRQREKRMLYANAGQECTAVYDYENGTTSVCTNNSTRSQNERERGRRKERPRLNGYFTRGLTMLPIFASIKCAFGRRNSPLSGCFVTLPFELK